MIMKMECATIRMRKEVMYDMILKRCENMESQRTLGFPGNILTYEMH